MRVAFAVCVQNGGCEASLEVRKVYRILRDVRALRLGLLRVVDEFGEDYLYPKEYFTPIELPQEAEKALNE